MLLKGSQRVKSLITMSSRQAIKNDMSSSAYIIIVVVIIKAYTTRSYYINIVRTHEPFSRKTRNVLLTCHCCFLAPWRDRKFLCECVCAERGATEEVNVIILFVTSVGAMQANWSLLCVHSVYYVHMCIV